MRSTKQTKALLGYGSLSRSFLEVFRDKLADRDLTVEQGYQAARECGLNLLATLSNNVPVEVEMIVKRR